MKTKIIAAAATLALMLTAASAFAAPKIETGSYFIKNCAEVVAVDPTMRCR